jgi:hypothetical protein
MSGILELRVVSHNETLRDAIDKMKAAGQHALVVELQDSQLKLLTNHDIAAYARRGGVSSIADIATDKGSIVARFNAAASGSSYSPDRPDPDYLLLQAAGDVARIQTAHE